MRAVRTPRAAAATLALVVTLVATACGGSSTSAPASPDGATIVPASALAYVSVDTDVISSQWKAVDGLLSKFPGKDMLLTKLEQALQKNANLDWNTDVKPALGPELDLAVLSRHEAVGLMQPKDEAKFAALIAKGNATGSGKLVTTKVDGWTVVADSQAQLDAFKQAASSGPKLADDSTFTSAMAGLSSEALVKAYANGEKVAQALQSAAGSSSVLANVTSGAAELVAADNGLKLDGTLKTSGGPPLEAYTPKLIDKVPTGALAFLSFKGTKSLQLGSLPAFGPRIGSLIERVSTILANENALYVRPGTPLPEVTLVATPDDPSAAVDSIGAIFKLLGCKLSPPENGITEANFGRFSLFYGIADGDVIVTDSRQGVKDFKGGSSLKDDPTFKEAVGVSGLPDQTVGFLYVNLKDAVPLVESLAQLSGTSIPPIVSSNLAPLRTFTVYGTSRSGEIGFTAFLEVK